jgi:tetratricopeptide (TPR) repeat protein
MRSRVFLSVIVLAFLGVSISAQNRSTVTGYVFGPERAPVDRAQVELLSDMNMVLGRTRTEASGRFSFVGVPSGRLSVRVLPLGTDLAEQTQEFEIAGIGVRGQLIPENVQLDFHLRPRKTAQSSTNSVVFAQEVPEEAKRIFTAAVSDLDAGRTEPGIVQIKKALAIFPTYFPALERLGMEYMKAEKFDEARETFEASSAVNPKSYQSWYGLAYADYATQKFEEAIQSADRALTLDKRSASAYFVLGISQRRLKKYNEAEKSLLSAKRYDEGKTPDINWNLALLYTHNLNRYPEAANELELYLKALPNEPNAEKIRKLIKDLRSRTPR